MNAPAHSAATSARKPFPRSIRKIFVPPTTAHPLDGLVGTRSGNVYTLQRIPKDFIPPENIKPCPQHLENHPQRDILEKPILILKDIQSLVEPFNDRGILCIGNTIPAAIRPSHPFPHNAYNKHQWIRDSVVAIETMLNAGDIVKASSCIEEILTFLSMPEQRNRIVEYHFNSSCNGSPHDTYLLDHAKRPFIRIPISRKAKLANYLIDRDNKKIEDGAHWAHDQLGSFGQLIRLVCLAHRTGRINLEGIYDQVLQRVAQVSPDSVEHLQKEHIIVSLQKFLYRISLVSAPDGKITLSLNTRGPWEEHPAKNRLSEMIPLLAGVSEFIKLHERANESILLAGDEAHQEEFIKQLSFFKGLLEENIRIQLPDLPDAVARESLELDGLDSVVALMMSPRLIKFTPLQQFAIIRTMLSNMGIAHGIGELNAPGIIRYRGDKYCAEDMHKLADEHWNVHHPKSPSYWTLFDPAIAAGFFMRACELGNTSDPKLDYRKLGSHYYRYGCRFLQRSASQVPTTRYEGKMRVGNTGLHHRFHYNPYDPVEAYYKNNDTGRYEPNTNVLTWTNAQRAEAFTWGRIAASMYENYWS